jgi:hypothetical protein
MAKMALGHHGHAFIHGVPRSDEDNRGGHDLVDLGFPGSVAHQRSFARVVALREDADQPIVGEDQQGADIVLGHHLDGFVDGLLGRYRQNPVVAFALQHHFNRVGILHSILLALGRRVPACSSYSWAAFVVAGRPKGFR